MNNSQFLRVHSYTPATATGILDEAARVPAACRHVHDPKQPAWHVGDVAAVLSGIDEHMAVPAKLTLADGRIVDRKRRIDHRCLVAGVISWPEPMHSYRDRAVGEDRREILRRWLRASMEWLQAQYREHLRAVCVHGDESHPHLHFFVVGDAQRLHPGLRAELVNDRRIEEPAARFEAHKRGLRAWLDDYHFKVGQRFQLTRKLNAKPAWRVRDSAVRHQLLKLDRRLADLPDPLVQAVRDEFFDESTQSLRPRMRY